MTAPEQSPVGDRQVDKLSAAHLDAERHAPAPDRAAPLAGHSELAADLKTFGADHDAMQPMVKPVSAANTADAATLAPGQPTNVVPETGVLHFGDYEIIHEIARGGMGVVYKARQLSLNRMVALKMILAGQLATPQDVHRFHREAEAVANLDHPHIVPIYEVGAHQGQHFFGMRLIDGASLAQCGARSAERGPNQEKQKQSAKLLTTVARAVHHAHQRGILHRDLKPGNILIDAEGQPHVTDFGLAQRVDISGAVAATTQSGAIVGTPAYMAPEQARGEKGLTTAVDVYSLGAILYEQVAGRPLFQGATPLDVVLQVLEREPPAPRLVNPQVDRDLETICLKCLEKQSSKRYGSAEALAEDLERWRAGEPIQARPVGRLERGWRWCCRNPGVAMASAAALLALVLGAASVGLYAVDQKRHADQLADDAESLRQEQERTQEALRVATAEKERAEDKSRAVQRLLALNHLDRGLALCEQGEPQRGVFWLARALDTPQPGEFERVTRANLSAWQALLPQAKNQLVHQGSVSKVAFSPDGKTMLTGSYDHTARLWDSATGMPLGAPLSHQGPVVAVAFSPDGKRVLTGSHDHTARLWDSVTGIPIGAPLSHRGPVVTVAFSPDGKTALTGSFDKTARLWDSATGAPLGASLSHQGPVVAVTFSPDGQTAFTGSRDLTARLWDTTDWSLLRTLRQAGSVDAVAFSPDGKTLLTGSDQIGARLWDVAGGKRMGPPLADQGAVVAVAFSPDGKVVLTGSEDHTARLWDSATGKPIGPPLPHQGKVLAVAFSPDGKAVLTGSEDHTARLWDSATNKPLGAPLSHGGAVVAVAFRPDAKTVLTGSDDNTALQWDLPTGNPTSTAIVHQGIVYAVAFSPDGKPVLTGSSGRGGQTARLWDSETGTAIGAPLTHANAVVAVAFSPDGQRVLTGSLDWTARLWDSTTGKPVSAPLLHRSSVRAVAFSPDGKRVLTGSSDHMARLWDSATGTLIGAPLAHQADVVAVAFSPDGKTALTGSFDKTARLWDSATGKLIGAPLPHQGSVLAVAFSPDGKTVLTGGFDGARLWDAAAGTAIGAPLTHKGGVLTVVFSPGGKVVLTGSFDKTARLWDAATGKPISAPLPHDRDVVAAAFSPDGKTVLTGSKDHTARLWDSATGKLIGRPLPHQGEVVAVAFSPDGKTVLTGSRDHIARLWPVRAPLQGSAKQIACWLSVITGLELEYDGLFQVLDAQRWRQARRQLEEIGGAPQP
jgi:WD40 repeat protein